MSLALAQAEAIALGTHIKQSPYGAMVLGGLIVRDCTPR